MLYHSNDYPRVEWNSKKGPLHSLSFTFTLYGKDIELTESVKVERKKINGLE